MPLLIITTKFSAFLTVVRWAAFVTQSCGLANVNPQVNPSGRSEKTSESASTRDRHSANTEGRSTHRNTKPVISLGSIPFRRQTRFCSNVSASCWIGFTFSQGGPPRCLVGRFVKRTPESTQHTLESWRNFIAKFGGNKTLADDKQAARVLFAHPRVDEAARIRSHSSHRRGPRIVSAQPKTHADLDFFQWHFASCAAPAPVVHCASVPVLKAPLQVNAHQPQW